MHHLIAQVSLYTTTSKIRHYYLGLKISALPILNKQIPQQRILSIIKRIGTTARASKIVKYNGVAYLSGQVGEGATIQQQTLDCLTKVDTLLLEAGSSKIQMLRATIWLSDMSHFSGLNEIWNEWVPEGHAPARACGEAKLARAELMVEIIVDAAYS